MTINRDDHNHEDSYLAAHFALNAMGVTALLCAGGAYYTEMPGPSALMGMIAASLHGGSFLLWYWNGPVADEDNAAAPAVLPPAEEAAPENIVYLKASDHFARGIKTPAPTKPAEVMVFNKERCRHPAESLEAYQLRMKNYDPDQDCSPCA